MISTADTPITTAATTAVVKTAIRMVVTGIFDTYFKCPTFSRMRPTFT